MTRLESDYYAYMDFDPHGEHAREVQSFYVPMFADKSPVVDLGCGRGDFLSMLHDTGIKAVGVDSDEGMVEQARGQGLDVALDDAIEYLHADPPPGPSGGSSAPTSSSTSPPSRSCACSTASARCSPPAASSSPPPRTRPAMPCSPTTSGGTRPTSASTTPRSSSSAARPAWRSRIRANPQNHPGPPPGFLAPEATVHPGLDDVLDAATSQVRASIDHHDRRAGSPTSPRPVLGVPARPRRQGALRPAAGDAGGGAGAPDRARQPSMGDVPAERDLRARAGLTVGPEHPRECPTLEGRRLQPVPAFDGWR